MIVVDLKKRSACCSLLFPKPQSTMESQASTHQSSRVDIEARPLQASRAMIESLQNLRDALRCSLCQNVYHEPMTLSCSHTFCRDCIDRHACNSWQCPCTCVKDDAKRLFSVAVCVWLPWFLVRFLGRWQVRAVLFLSLQMMQPSHLVFLAKSFCMPVFASSLLL